MRIRLFLGALLIVAAQLPALAVPSPQASAPGAAATTPNREALELARLEAEIAKLRGEAAAAAPWYAAPLVSGATVLIGFLGVMVTGLLGLRTALSTRVHEFDTRLFEARLQAYGALLAPTRVFALHFPERFVDRDVCAQAGRELRKEYFGLAGTLMTMQARRRYMTLQLLLTRAARAESLRVPTTHSDYADWIDEEKINRYRELLELTPRADPTPDDAAKAEMAACRDHIFVGQPVPAGAAADPASEMALAQRFQDFVALQFAASRLRTELGHDVSARRPIADLIDGAGRGTKSA
jgi:hypothetical protein